MDNMVGEKDLFVTFQWKFLYLQYVPTGLT